LERVGSLHQEDYVLDKGAAVRKKKRRISYHRREEKKGGREKIYIKGKNRGGKRTLHPSSPSLVGENIVQMRLGEQSRKKKREKG